MAKGDIVFVKTGAGEVPAVVLEQRDAAGAAGASNNDAVVADLLLLGIDQARRTLEKGAGEGQFQF